MELNAISDYRDADTVPETLCGEKAIKVRSGQLGVRLKIARIFKSVLDFFCNVHSRLLACTALEVRFRRCVPLALTDAALTAGVASV